MKSNLKQFLIAINLTNRGTKISTKVQNIKAQLITPVYTMISENLGYIAFTIGGAATFLVRGQDMYQKAQLLLLVRLVLWAQ